MSQEGYAKSEIEIMKDYVSKDILALPAVLKIEVGKFSKGLPAPYKGYCIITWIQKTNSESELDLARNIAKIMEAHNVPWNAFMTRVGK